MIPETATHDHGVHGNDCSSETLEPAGLNLKSTKERPTELNLLDSFGIILIVQWEYMEILSLVPLEITLYCIITMNRYNVTNNGHTRRINQDFDRL